MPGVLVAFAAARSIFVLFYTLPLVILQRSLRHAQLMSASWTDSKTGLLNALHLAARGRLLPVTIRFSRLVGQIMREIPRDREPLPQFKF